MFFLASGVLAGFHPRLVPFEMARGPLC